MGSPEIIAYLNPFCPWTPGVEAVLARYRLGYRLIDISRDHAGFDEMVQKSGQYSAPCVEIDGQMLADVGGDEVETWLRALGFIPAQESS